MLTAQKLFPIGGGRSRVCLMQGIVFVSVGAVIAAISSIPGLALMAFGATYSYIALDVYLEEDVWEIVE